MTEHLGHVATLRIASAKTFGPSNEHAMVNPLLTKRDPLILVPFHCAHLTCRDTRTVPRCYGKGYSNEERTHCEAKRQCLAWFEQQFPIVISKVCIHERLQTFGTEIKKFLSVVLLLLLGKTVLGLCDFEFPFALEIHETDTKIGAA